MFRLCKIFLITKKVTPRIQNRICQPLLLQKSLKYCSIIDFSTFNTKKSDYEEDYLIRLDQSLQDESNFGSVGILRRLLAEPQSRNYIENIILFLRNKNRNDSTDSLANQKVEKMTNIIFKHIRELSAKENALRSNLQFFTSFTTFQAFLDILKLNPLKSAVELANKIFLSNFIYLIQNQKIVIDDFIKILKEVNLSKDNLIKQRAIDPHSTKVLDNFLEEFLKIQEKHTPENLKEVSEFITYFAENFQLISQKYASLLHKKCLECLSNIETDPTQIQIFAESFPVLLSFHKIAKEPIIECINMFQNKVPRSQFEPYCLDFMINCFEKIKGNKTNPLSSQVFLIFNYLLAEPIQDVNFCSTKLSPHKLIILGDLIMEKKLEPQPLTNLLKAQLEPEFRSKIDIHVIRSKFLYDIQFKVSDSSLDPENMLNAWPDGKKPQSLSDLTACFFEKLYPYFSFQGLLLMYHIISKKFIILSKNEILLRSAMKRKCISMTEEQIFEALDFFKLLEAQKSFLNWISTFDQLWINLLKNSKNQFRFQSILSFAGRRLLIYQDFRTIDILIDHVFSERSDKMRIRDLEFTLSTLAHSGLSCFNFFQRALNRFESEYMNIELNISINICSKFAFLGMHLNDHILDYIVNRFEEAAENDIVTRHVSTPLKLLSSIILFNRFQKYKPALYVKLFKRIKYNLDQNYSQFEKEDMFGNTNFAGNLFFFAEYIRLIHPDYFKELQKDYKIIEILNLMKKNVKPVEGIATAGQNQIVSMLKTEYPQFEFKENVTISDKITELDILVKDKQDGKEFVIEIFGPSHFKIHAPSEILPTSMIGLDIKRSYYPVIIIPYFEWYNLPTKKAKVTYLKVMLQSFLQKNFKSQE